MDALDNFLNQHREKGRVQSLSPIEYKAFIMSVLREAVRIEHANAGAPGKAAIEYLLNQKYQIVQNRQLNRYVQTELLKQVDQVIDLIVKKYHVDRSGKNFYFDESIEFVITAPDKFDNSSIGNVIANLYAAKCELNALKIQLTKTHISNPSQTKLVQDAVINKEKELEYLKRKLVSLKAFDSVSDQDLLYRRSLGESTKDDAKKAVGVGATIGAFTHGVISGQKAKKDSGLYKDRKKFLNTEKKVKEVGAQLSKADHDAYISTIRNAEKSTTKKLLDKADSLAGKQNKLNQLADARFKKLQNTQLKVNGRMLKGALKGAGIGAAVGLGALGVKKMIDKKKNETLSARLFSHLNKLNRIPIQEDSDNMRGYYTVGKGIRKLYKGLDGVYREGRLSRFKGGLNAIRKNRGLKAASIAGALLLGTAGIAYIIKRAREKGPEKVKGSIRSTQYKARQSKTLTNTEKIKIQNNGNAAVQKINQVFKINKRR